MVSNRLLRLSRLKDWWFFKIPYLLLVAYLAIAEQGQQFSLNIVIRISIILGGLIIAATFVGVIGEYFDREQDNIAQKDNGFKSMPNHKTLAIIGLIIIANALYLWFLIPSFEARLFYILAMLSFVLYYNPITRFKERPYLGILFDALGSQVFPAIFILYYVIENPFLIEPIKFGVLLIWLLFVGLRGIINHQYADIFNDIKSQTKTYVTQISGKTKRQFQKIAFSVEVIALTLLLGLTNLSLVICLIAILLYVILLMGRRISFNNMITFFDIHRNKPYTIALFEFYTFFFPNVILISLLIDNVQFAWLLGLHVVLFMKLYIDIVKELIKYSKSIFEV